MLRILKIIAGSIVLIFAAACVATVHPLTLVVFALPLGLRWAANGGSAQ